MEHKIKNAFGQITAAPDLKNQTAEYVLENMSGQNRKGPVIYKSIAAAAACILVLLIGGYQMYFTSVAEISVDINPSVLLEINRFDRIISVEGANADGEKLVNGLDIRFMPYTEAIDQIMSSETVSGLLLQDEIMTITVAGDDSRQSEGILSNVQSCTDQCPAVYCYYARSEDADKARDLGLSYPRYQAYLFLQRYGYSIEIDEIRNMSMREVRELVSTLTGQSEDGIEHDRFKGGKHQKRNGHRKNIP